MDLLSPGVVLLLKCAALLGVLGAGIATRMGMDVMLVLASLVLVLVCGIGAKETLHALSSTVADPNMWGLLLALLVMLTMGGLMDRTRQTRRFMSAVCALVPSPGLRLVLFPAFIGLLPVPGGAAFSCPMVKELGDGMRLSGLSMACINFWFRHIWEPVWPLFPGFILCCALTELDPFALILRCSPIFLVAVVAGWFCFLRRLPDAATEDTTERTPWKTAAIEGGPLFLGITLALTMHGALPHIPVGFTFAACIGIGLVICAVRNHASTTQIRKIMLTRKNLAVLRTVAAIFLFKAMMDQSGIAEDLRLVIADSVPTLVLIFLLAPVLGSMFTGMYLGTVGATYPILIVLLRQTPYWDDRLPWFTLACMACYVGQMITPIHVCIAVTAKFFEVPMGDILKRMVLPSAILVLTALVCFAVSLG